MPASLSSALVKFALDTYAKSCQDEAKAKEAAAEVYQFEKMLGFAPNVEVQIVSIEYSTVIYCN